MRAFFLLLLRISPARSSLFTSMVGLEKLIETESNMVDLLNRYIEAEKERLEKLKRYGWLMVDG